MIERAKHLPVAVVRSFGGNHLEEINDGAAPMMIPAKPLSTAPA